jgi:hypothetical protein
VGTEVFGLDWQDEHGCAAFEPREAARALKVGMPAVKTLIHRLRQRYAQLVRTEVERTVEDPNDVEAELHSLREADGSREAQRVS